jgi:sugar/nucleoside kinase (ribokinase family)
MSKYDSLIMGQVSLDINVDHTGQVLREVGGAVVASGFAASALGHKTCVLPKANLDEVDLTALFSRMANVDVIPLESPHCTSIENVYHTADKEKRTCRAISRIEPYRLDEMPDVDASIIHIAGLMRGDFGGEIIEWASGRAKCAVDVQCMLRCAEGPEGIMAFHDWPEKQKYLPLIRFLKTDAAEAEILTGLQDRREAAKVLYGWGAKEVMITHNTEVIVYDGEQFYAEPLVPRNLTGRTGRGDTCFSAYITERLVRPIGQALLTAAALVSLKMETPGPFIGTRADVEAYIKAFYR